jgi:hypothetical protein
MREGQAAVTESPDQSHEVELRLAMLRHWYGDQLSAEQWEEVRRQIGTEVVEVSQALAEVPLDHTDEPLPLFTPYRSDE